MKISLLGCGWLGLPLSKKLLEEGHIIKGSTTSMEKLSKLSEAGLIPYRIKLFAEGVQGDLSAFLEDSELLIIDIPPGLRSDPEANFIGKIGRLKDFIEKSSIKRVLFVSATSVYEDTEEFPVYTEEDSSNGTAENSLQLKSAENELKNSEHYEATIVRFGGLFGPDRHPVNYLSGKKNVKDPKAPVNLIHLEDCIGIISKIIEKEAWGITFNAVYPEHPTKAAYYTRIAEEKNLGIPEFDLEMVSKGKRIESVTLEEVLDYSFQQGIY
ncbi:SDR family NAD(P)-dependent oxidoreductase [Gillisia sp. Q332]|uniref:SDR family NAD(P)-dependent oxidoreductase n=1 Tax=Gillisia xinjiangensis TaxID=3384765 RepID=UPI00391D2029